ncbi:AEC family transporter [Vibrio sp. SM6]|uniref:AEC family transporter n=1 Tax=Vibrio agarilyticus TaxID=2726741 RepID=A0A7X8YIH8_9VIBR|nr:AEC family transporter [Vibrio agarilyticus]NLS14635.1 AEC family transporter [Vibrio agarilyticus]
MLPILLFSLSITGPICLMLVLGVLFKRMGLINENFIEVGSKLVFQVTLPAMLFLSIANAGGGLSLAQPFILYGLLASVVFFVFTSVAVKAAFPQSADSGVIIQGSFRANTAIIGIAYVANAYGAQGVAVAALYVAVTTILYNVLATLCLTPKGGASGFQLAKLMGKSLTKNPLIISIVAGGVVYGLSVPVPSIVTESGQYLARMTLPLALLCTGGSLDLSAMRASARAPWFATLFKLVLAPVLITLGGAWLGFRNIELAVLFFMNAAPVAAASYVMARSMGGNAALAANIIALTTLLSTFTCSLGVMVLTSLGLIAT